MTDLLADLRTENRMENSSSLRNFNADRKLTKPQSALWLLMNWAENCWMPNRIFDDNLIIQKFKCAISNDDWGRLQAKSSPSRKLCELFWIKFPWTKTKSELGEIKILDVGCGDGNLGARLQSYSNNSVASYAGVDINRHKTWDVLMKEHKNFVFRQICCSKISDCIPSDANFILTQSALEHFEGDLTFFEQIRNFILDGSKNVIQVHMLPSSVCLKLYPLHGVRQYTRRKISKITSIFRDFSYSVLYELGGKYCNRLHWEFITKPWNLKKVDLREIKTSEYTRESGRAIQEDMSHPSGTPTFYALIIHSNWDNKLFPANFEQPFI